MSGIFAKASPRPLTCDGRGYWLRAPRNPEDWDVDLVRIDCLGCVDCFRGELMPIAHMDGVSPQDQEAMTRYIEEHFGMDLKRCCAGASRIYGPLNIEAVQ